MTSAKSVFVCYAHADSRKWLNLVREHLAPVVRHDQIAVWSDQNLRAGDKWDDEIAQQLASARVAILLVSRAFLASDYIVTRELPLLVERWHNDGLVLLPVLVNPCSVHLARIESTGGSVLLSEIQAFGDPKETLSEMRVPERDRVLIGLADRIHEILSTAHPAAPADEPDEERSAFSISHLPGAGEFLIGRETELARLSAAWESPREHILTVVARGGEGKSNLVRHWLNNMAANGWRGAERVYGWSFYSQGTNDKAASADQFVDQALRFFGEPHPENLKSADARGERLAQLVGAKRNLLVLDGLEPLQYPPGAMHGRLKDPALQTLIYGLLAQNHGLCVITTREELPELASTRHTLSPEIQLPPLAPEAGAKLLADLGVTGPDEDRRDVARRLGGHAFSIQLLGTYLTEVFGGDVSRAGEVALLDEDSEAGKHARHLLGSYEKWLSGRTLAVDDLSPDEAEAARRTGAEMLAVLRLLGLFDRPATMDAIEVLCAEPAIPSLTEPLVSLTEAGWKRTLARLRNLQLIDHDLGEVETLDAHPLVREYFEKQLDRIPESTREAHLRLYEYFKNAAPQLPETLREMTPLFQAVVHGCKAGAWQEVLDDVFYRRVQRGSDAFAERRLGATGACLASLSAFFNEPWRHLAAPFSPNDTLYVIGAAGYYLRAVGRVQESLEPMKVALDIALGERDWNNASQGAENLSEVYLTIGNVAEALRTAEHAVELAARNRSTELGNRITDVAESLHAAGAIPEAFTAFDAGQEEFRRVTGVSFLVGLAGVQHMDLLLTTSFVNIPAEQWNREQLHEFRQRNEYTVQISDRQLSLHTSAFSRLMIARTLMFEGVDRARAGRQFDEGVSLLREAAQVHFLPYGLLWRAEFARTLADRHAADRDLTECEQLADRHGMLRWQIECAVERARFRDAFGEPDEAREKLLAAKRMIAKTDKPYVPHVWTFEETEPPPFVGVFEEGQIVGYHRCDRAIAELEQRLGLAAD